MKKFLFGFSLTSFLFLCLYSIFALAQAATPGPTPIDTNDLIQSSLGALQTWKTLGVWAGISALINILINVLKTKTFGSFFDKILPEKFQGLFVVVLGVLTVIIGVKVSGGTWVEGIVAGVQSSAGAMMFHEVIQDVFNTTPKTPVVAATPAPTAPTPPAA